MYSHPGEYRKILLANYLCIGFVPGGTIRLLFIQDVGEGGLSLRGVAFYDGFDDSGEHPFVRARHGAEKASCGETVVQKGVFGESVSSLRPQGLLVKHLKTSRAQRRNGLSKNTLLDNRFSARLLRSFGAPPF